MDLTSIFITGIVFGTIYGIIYLLIRKKERMALIEKGLDANIFMTEKISKKRNNLKYGLLSTGVGLGILLGNIFVNTNLLEEEVAYFSMIFLFGGISLLIDFFLERKMK